nr:class I SAM-dependent methyltransferase [Kibdelosporangium sp. MJ126-NF4]CEL13609.1 tetratricopeptide repeat domain protein [Kibdelosporangium sp. MJ126-NF4]CTQ99295.1 tetratricopeptide repeat domain protein [Kibdelosporangium sp. MJ126-NF4]
MTVYDALAALAAGNPDQARKALDDPAPRHPLLRGALATYLEGDASESVYHQPAAFEAFIDGGGNIPLYDAVSGALAEQYRAHGVTSLVDVGCGNGRALIPALAATPIPAVTLVEPSQALLDTAVARLGDQQVTPVPSTADVFANGLHEDARFDLAESTFALHTMPHEDRSAVLAALRPHVDRFVVVEFDVLDQSPEDRRTLLADTYERGIAEYDSDRDLVAQGFLMPVLTGQLAPGAVRSTWEQPMRAWVEQFTACGYQGVRAEILIDYWAAPSFLLSARGGQAQQEAQ